MSCDQYHVVQHQQLSLICWCRISDVFHSFWQIILPIFVCRKCKRWKLKLTFKHFSIYGRLILAPLLTYDMLAWNERLLSCIPLAELHLIHHFKCLPLRLSILLLTTSFRLGPSWVCKKMPHGELTPDSFAQSGSQCASLLVFQNTGHVTLSQGLDVAGSYARLHRYSGLFRVPSWVTRHKEEVQDILTLRLHQILPLGEPWAHGIPPEERMRKSVIWVKLVRMGQSFMTEWLMGLVDQIYPIQEQGGSSGCFLWLSKLKKQFFGQI